MSAPETLPISGYALERVYAQRQLCETLEPGNDAPTTQDLTVGWDWRITAADRFEVLVRVQYVPTRERPEQVEVAIVGVFRGVGNTQTVDVLQFVRVHAPSILMPYAREIVSSMTGRGAFGPSPVYFPPINVANLMERMDTDVATGAEQLRKNPALLQFQAGQSQSPNQISQVSATTD